jgi:hypothetical protein
MVLPAEHLANALLEVLFCPFLGKIRNIYIIP